MVDTQIPTCDYPSSHYDTLESESESWECRSNGDEWPCEQGSGLWSRSSQRSLVCHFLSPFLSSEGRAQSYLSRTEISNRTAIHHWLTCYWSPVHLLFSTKLYCKKRITNVCTFATSASDTGEKEKKMQRLLCYISETCQEILFKEIRVVV